MNNAETIARHWHERMQIVQRREEGPKSLVRDWDKLPGAFKDALIEVFTKLLAEQVIVPGPKR